jgi:thiol:disulfide interchange protein DsbD
MTTRLRTLGSLPVLTLLLALLGCALVAGSAAAQSLPGGNATRSPFGASNLQGPGFLPVEEAYQLAIDVTPDSLRLYWQIADGYYLYQHAFDIALRSGDKPVPHRVELPLGEDRTDEFFGDVTVYYLDADVRIALEEQVERAQLTVTSQGCADAGLCYPPRTQRFDIDFGTGTATELSPPARNTAPAGAGMTSGVGSATAGMTTVLYMLLLAFVGGSILNLMPCVFPILSLKVLAFARADANERHRHGWWYTAGVVASFLLVAAVLVALQTAGRAIGWGFQLQSPAFVIGLAYLFIAMGLSLSGLVHFGGSLMNVGGGLASRSGNSGSFFTGVLAVLVASPCTAPFMGTALGFALTQPAVTSVAIFAALGAGMAAPLLLLSYSNTARRLMPAPGAWMETLKQALAFPLYATAIWLLWVAGRQTGVDTLAVALFGALLLALGLWLWGPGIPRKAGAVLVLLLAFASGSWRGDSGAERELADRQNAWSPSAVAEAQARGQPVFVDFTADWCITCLANERTVLHTDATEALFAARNTVYLVADWTNYDARIADFLSDMGRSGIPLYLLYPAEPGAAPLVLPQLLRRRHLEEAFEQLSSR